MALQVVRVALVIRDGRVEMADRVAMADRERPVASLHWVAPVGRVVQVLPLDQMAQMAI